MSSRIAAIVAGPCAVMVPVAIEDLTRHGSWCGATARSAVFVCAAPAFTVPAAARPAVRFAVLRSGRAAARLAARRRALDAVVHAALSFGRPLKTLRSSTSVLP